MHMPKLIIFDIDGTLLNSTNIEDQCYQEAFEELFGKNIAAYKWEDITHVTDWGITEEIFQHEFGQIPTTKDYARMQQVFFEKLKAAYQDDPSHFKEVPEAKDFFEHLHTHPDYCVGIATGSWEKNASFKLKSIGIDPTVFPFGNSDHQKSRSDILQYAFARANSLYEQAFEEIIYFGDGLWDYKTCKELGVKFIGIDVKEDGKLKSAGAEIVFKDFSASQSILKML